MASEKGRDTRFNALQGRHSEAQGIADGTLGCGIMFRWSGKSPAKPVQTRLKITYLTLFGLLSRRLAGDQVHPDDLMA